MPPPDASGGPTGPYDNQSSLIDAAALKFDQAWQDRQADPPDIAAFLVGAGQPRYHLLLRLCAIDLERHQLAADLPNPRVEDYLTRFPELVGDLGALLDLVTAEVAARQRAGVPIHEAEYVARFPALAGVRAVVAGSTAEALPRVPGYDLLRRLGRGGMGAVYLARDVALNREVALKVVLAGAHAGGDELARFGREAEVAAGLVHPNVARVYSSGNAGGFPYFTMEYCPGGSLADHVRDDPLEPAEAARLVARVARGVAHAHAAGLVHRDLKPENVLVGADGEPKVADFGLARRLGEDGLTATEARMGTPGYMPPEQAAGGTREAGPAADTYGLGATLYRLVCGRAPFVGPTPSAVLRQVLDNEPVPPRELVPSVPRDLETVILKCLRKEPERRYASAADLADDLDRHLRGEPIVARRVGLIERTAKWCRRNQAAAGLIVALLLGTAGSLTGAAVAIVERNRARSAEAATAAAEQEKSGLLVKSYADAGRIAAQRGLWTEAIENIDLALDGGHPEVLSLRLEKVKALRAMNRQDEAEKELDALDAPTREGSHRGLFLRLRGDLGLGVDNEAALALQAALSPPYKLTAADEAYIHGQLAKSSTEALEHFNRALEYDRGHHSARTSALMVALLLGRFDAAADHVAVGQTLFPEDPAFVIARAWLAGLRDGDLPQARKLLASVRSKLSASELDAIETATEVLHQHRDFRRQLYGGGGPVNPLQELKQRSRIAALVKRFALPEAKQPVVALRLPPLVERSCGVWRLVVPRLVLPFAPAVADLREKLDAAVVAHEEGFAVFGRTIILDPSNQAVRPMAPKGVRMLTLEEAEQGYLRAADLPSLVDVRAVALDQALASMARRIFVDGKVSDRKLADRFLATLRRRLRIQPIDRVDLQVTGHVVVFAKVASALGEYDLARLILTDAERLRGDDPGWWALRAEIEERANVPSEAVRYAKRVLEKQQTNKTMLDLLERLKASGVK